MREKVERTKTTNTSTFSLISEEIKGPNEKLPGGLARFHSSFIRLRVTSGSLNEFSMDRVHYCFQPIVRAQLLVDVV